jgi:PE family
MFVTTQPEALTAAAAGLQGIGASVVAGNAAALAPTTAPLSPAVTDPVSDLLEAFFVAHAGMYQGFAAEAAVVHELFVTTMGVSSGSYAVTEGFNALAAL